MKTSDEPKKTSGANESKAHSAPKDEGTRLQHNTEPAKGEDMGHIEDFIDSLQDHELEHAHKHISAKMLAKQDAAGDSKPDISMDDFEKVKKAD